MTLPNKSQGTFPRALTIAGFDPSGGAGVLADVRTFAAFGVQASAVITSLTLQNAARVFGAFHQTAEVVSAQAEPLVKSQLFACTKTGMLPTREVVLEVVRLFRETDLPRPVVDPVIMSSSGQRLMESDAFAVLLDELIPLARVVTPNIPEAEALTGTTINSEADMRRAAAIIRGLGARAVLVKGGHLLGARASCPPLLSKTNAGKIAALPAEDAGKMPALPEEEAGGTPAVPEEAIDVLDDEGKVTVFREQRVSGAELHGSGCIMSAAIAAGLGKGMTLEDSVRAAKSYVLEAIRSLRPGQ
jgi:hydroxymethylpyrimidine kinase/phosphomethylpyrimidine kinase